MKKIFSYLIYFVLALSIVGNVILSIAYNGQSNLADEVSLGDLQHFKNSFPLEEKTEGISLAGLPISLIDKDNRLLKFEDLKLEKPTLVFRVPRYSCSVCVDREIRAIKALSDSIHDSKRIIVLTAYDNLRDYFVFLKSYQSDIPFYNIARLDIPAENDEHPYFFVIDCNKSIQHVFFPFKQNETFSTIYHNSFMDQYLNQECTEKTLTYVQ